MSLSAVLSALNHGQRRLRWEAYLFRTGLLRSIWDIRGAPTLRRQLAAARIFDQSNGHCIADEDPIFDDPSIRREDRLPHHTYLYDFHEKAVIEPAYGFVVVDPSAIIELSVQCSYLARNRATVHHLCKVPSMRQHHAARRETPPTRKVETVVTLRHVWDYAYYHFYIDLMACLKILNDYGVSSRIPLVISPALARQTFFQEMIQRGRFAGRNWIVQEGFSLRADQVIFAKPDIEQRQQLDFFLDQINAPGADLRKNRRIFLTRDRKSGRDIANIGELEPVLQQWGFELVDSEQMTVAHQIELFRETAVLIGIHGSGLTNMVYRRDGPLTLVEIFPPNEAFLHYYHLARLYGFAYRYIRGHSPTSASRRASFFLDVALLENTIRQIL